MEEGKINSVYYKDGVPVCSVQIQDRSSNEDDAVPVMRQHHGQFLVPEQGQRVQMLKLGKQRFIVGILDRGAEYGNPSLGPGEVAWQLDDETLLSFTKNNSGDYDVRVEASGDVLIEGISFEDHTHEYSDDDGSSTTDKDTGPPE